MKTEFYFERETATGPINEADSMSRLVEKEKKRGKGVQFSPGESTWSKRGHEVVAVKTAAVPSGLELPETHRTSRKYFDDSKIWPLRQHGKPCALCCLRVACWKMREACCTVSSPNDFPLCIRFRKNPQHNLRYRELRSQTTHSKCLNKTRTLLPVWGEQTNIRNDFDSILLRIKNE